MDWFWTSNEALTILPRKTNISISKQKNKIKYIYIIFLGGCDCKYVKLLGRKGIAYASIQFCHFQNINIYIYLKQCFSFHFTTVGKSVPYVTSLVSSSVGVRQISFFLQRTKKQKDKMAKIPLLFFLLHLRAAIQDLH